MLSCLKNVIILAQNNLTNEAKIQKKWPKPTFYNFKKKKKKSWAALASFTLGYFKSADQNCHGILLDENCWVNANYA